MSEPSFVPAAGLRLEARRIVPPHSHGSIVLLHEALGSVSHWRDFPRQLAERAGMDVLWFSRQGHGWSDGPAQPRSRRYYEQQALTVLPAFLAAEPVQHPILFGHSEGAAIALIYAAHYPEQVRALVLESPILLAEPAAAAGMAIAEQAWRETDFRERLARHHRDPEAVFRAWLSIRESDGLLEPPLRDHLPPVSCPILMLQGGRDEYATGLQAQALRSLAPQMQLLPLPESGHTPHREQAQTVLDAVARFLDALPAAG